MLRPSLRCPLASSRTRSPRRLYSSSALLLTSDNASSSARSSTPQRSPLPSPPRTDGEDEHVSDQEWELRTGRAMDILQQSLPNFFNTGLVSTNYHLPIHIHGLLGGSLSTLGTLAKGKGRADEHGSQTPEEEGIYARAVRLEYTPPVALPAPFPRMLRVEGLPLYVASSVFVRHAMNALYTDLAVAMHKVKIHCDPPPPNAASLDSPSVPGTTNDKQESRQKKRERAITIGLLVSGSGRLGLSTERAEWDVTSTYTFSPRTGRIMLHTVNAIHPAPSETVYAAFQSALSALGSGIGPAANRKGAMNVARGQSPR